MRSGKNNRAAKKRQSELMDEQRAANWLNVSIATLRRARQAGKVKFYRIGAWRVLYSENQLQEFLDQYCQAIARPNVRQSDDVLAA
jgi:hypothetical protein